MTSRALDIANQINAMSDSEEDFLAEIRNKLLLKFIDSKLEESMESKTLSDEEVAAHLEKLEIA